MSAQATRDVIYFASAPTDGSPALQGLATLGWHLRRADSMPAVLKILRGHAGMRFAAVIDLRGGFDARDLAAMAPMLSAGNAGWVACVQPDQLALEPIRQLIRDYCYDYVTLPCPEQVLSTVIGHAYGMASLSPRVQDEPAGDVNDGMIGECPPMRALYRALRKSALTQAPVFIAGETGTGKELAALAIHRHSSRHDQPFAAINCGAIAQNLVQSELFGYERGAFTGAQQRKIGRIEHAHHGTLFLDEIGDLPLDCQASLLRFLQEGCFERVGGHESIRVDVRIISATHQDLRALIAEGRFRADLYHRLCVLRLEQPPLRERGDDIVRLAENALRRYANEGRRVIRGFSPCAIHALHTYEWPGNVRELINRVRQAVVMADGRLITAEDLHLADEHTNMLPQTLEEARNNAECDAIQQALRRNRHRLIDAARDLGVSRVTLYRLIERHGLRRPDSDANAAGAA
ncbi:DNA-binding NtrC family response regulator [Luteimonas cucumeris]|uniref:DNA-binding NtrC family response regulator n=1 Tax=Luteimonas cucumeris TaxID=985012 RepID=A0A562KVM2_9GAMM|nr:sigma-54 dependent transcriptional regulator [Luteimonas cucumeris]TWH99471.1 DNA-binding NtrC family response regulator [Luteimonas cucumeris]